MLENCGPANVILNNVRELINLQPDINIIIVSYRTNLENNDFENNFRRLGIDEFYVLDKYPNILQKLIYFKNITKDVDIIHSNGFFPDLFSSTLSKRLIKVSTVHSIISKDYPATYGLIKGSLYALLHHGVYLNPRFDNIVACSNVVEEHIAKYSIFNKSKIMTIHNGINRNYFNTLSLKDKNIIKNRIFQSLAIKNDEENKVFVYCGRLTRLKRVPELIKWFMGLTNPKNILIILGDGDEMEICRKTAATARNIFFIGHVNETTPYYQIADYVISNSSLEGFPMGILEGMSCGCMALLSEIPAHNEVIKYFPNMAMLLSNFELETSTYCPSKDEIFYLSATRMCNQYLTVYNNKFKLKGNTF